MSKDGLCAIVTGSASGLGAATAAILAKDGARIVVNYSSSQKEADRPPICAGRRAAKWWSCRAMCPVTRIAGRSSRPRPRGDVSMR